MNIKKERIKPSSKSASTQKEKGETSPGEKKREEESLRGVMKKPKKRAILS